ncbi:hypothetical protein N8569_00935 [bacterium]|nr:hypothetical protein [bacterium]
MADRVRAIKTGLHVGLNQRQIAARLGISETVVSDLKLRYVTGEKALTSTDSYMLALYDNWLHVHDIRGIGARAVEETG